MDPMTYTHHRFKGLIFERCEPSAASFTPSMHSGLRAIGGQLRESMIKFRFAYYLKSHGVPFVVITAFDGSHYIVDDVSCTDRYTWKNRGYFLDQGPYMELKDALEAYLHLSVLYRLGEADEYFHGKPLKAKP